MRIRSIERIIKETANERKGNGVEGKRERGKGMERERGKGEEKRGQESKA